MNTPWFIALFKNNILPGSTNIAIRGNNPFCVINRAAPPIATDTPFTTGPILLPQ